MDIAFEDYVKIIEDDIDTRIENLEIDNIKDKKNVIKMSQCIAYVFSSLITPAVTPFNLLLSSKRKGNNIVFDFTSEIVYGPKDNLGSAIVKFDEYDGEYNYQGIDLKLNSHYFLIHGNIDKIR